MIAVTNIDLANFQKLCQKTVERLNNRGDALLNFNGTKLEAEVAKEAKIVSQQFKGNWTVKLISGHKFPDIQVGDVFGIEVKSSKDEWKVTGGSVLESTRVSEIEKINIIFGKLSSPVKFMTRPYEDCLYDVAVTHSPRYLIDMELKTGETIFDKVCISYDEIRQSEEPIRILLEYKRKESPNANYWWDYSKGSEQDSSPASITIINDEPECVKQYRLAEAFICFPDIFSNSPTKFHNLAVYWITKESLLCCNIRDLFTASGQPTINGRKYPAIYGRFIKAEQYILQYFDNHDRDHFFDLWGVEDNGQHLADVWFRLLEQNIRTNSNDVPACIALVRCSVAKIKAQMLKS